MNKPLKGFIAYSHKDTEKKDELRIRLDVMRQQNKLVTWHDGDITGGGKARQEEILKEVADSDILLYLVSAASLASENCKKELAEALNFNIRVIPIILEHSDWLNHQLSDFQAFPDKGKPINEWEPESKGWQNVVDGVRKVVEEMQASVSEETLPEWVFQQGNFLLMLGQTDMAIEAYSYAIELDPNKTDAYNNRGAAHIIKGNYTRAIADFTKAINLNPNYADAYSNRGFAYADKGDSSRAITDYTKAIDLNPDNVNAYNNRGVVYSKMGDSDRAIVDFNKAIELNPNYANAYSNRGKAYFNKGDSDRSIADFTQAINLNHVESYYNRGVVYSNKGDSDRAIKDYTQAISLKSDYVIAYNNRGNAYFNKGDSDRAIKDYTKAIEIQPDFAEAYANRGAAYSGKGEIERAIQDYTKAIKLNPNDDAVYNNRGNIYRGTGDYNRAIEDYTKAINLKPDFVEVYYSARGVAYHAKGDFDRAITDFTKAINLKPNFAAAYYNRGAAYSGKGDFDRAIEDYTKAINLNPNHVDAYYNRGLTYHTKDDYDRAIQDYNTAIALKPDYTAAYNNRGGAYSARGNDDEAIVDFTKAIDLNPNDAEAYINRGVAYDNKGDFDRAIVDFNTAVQLNPDGAAAYYNRGGAYYNKGDYDRAIVDYTKVIELKPDDTEAHNNRGVAYYKRGDFDRAIEDYDTAIQLNSDYADTYYNRGEAWLHLKEWDKARVDLTTARDKGSDIIASFHNDYKNVEAYERANRVKLPEDIAMMLTQPRRSRFPRTQKILRADGTPLESSDVLNLLAKLRDAGPPLSQYVPTRPTFGIRTGASGAFVVDSATRDQLIADHPASADVLKPFLHGRDIRRWGVAKPETWLIFTYRRIEINRYPAIRKHLEQYRSVLSKRAGKQKWYELPTTRSNAELFTQAKLICPDNYDHQTFAVDTDGFYCGDTCYLIPTAETWLCGLLNSRVVEWFYSQTSNQLTGEYLRARSRYMQQIPVPDLTSAQKSLIRTIVDYLIFLQGQPTTSGVDLAHSRDFIMLGYFERIIDGLVYESYLREALHQGEKQFFKPLFDERLPQIEEIRGDKMAALQEIFERLYERTHPIRRNLFFLDSVKPIRIIEGKA